MEEGDGISERQIAVEVIFMCFFMGVMGGNEKNKRSFEGVSSSVDVG